MCFTSSAGQTYFIGIFGPEIRSEFELSHTEWGLFYMTGTLLSALVLPFSGQLVDRINLRTFVCFVMGGLFIACLMISNVTNVWFLVPAIFLLRQFGQGLTSHVSITSMARYMGTHRGKAIAFSSMGYSIGEATLPVLAVMLIMTIGWRTTYLLAAVGVLALAPLILLCLKDHPKRHETFLQKTRENDLKNGSAITSKTRSQILKEKRFYLLLPAVLAPSFIGTALFFHHLTLAETKGWSASWVTGSYWIYALMTVVTSLFAGPIIDRYSAARVIPYYLVPIVLAMLLLWTAEHPVWVVPYMILIGLNTGIYFTAISALWAELYGPTHLGSIKSMVGAFGVFASALGPVSIGALLDFGYSYESACLGMALLCIISTVFLHRGLKQYATMQLKKLQ